MMKKKILLTTTTLTAVLVAVVGIFILSAPTGFTSVNENLVDGKEGCIDRVLNLATLGEIKSVSTYDTAILSCG
jgi:uncharacterized protein YpmB